MQDGKVEGLGRHVAVVAGALVAGAFEAAHILAFVGDVNWWCVGWVALGVLLELEALGASFDVLRRGRHSSLAAYALCGAVALGVGVGESFLGWGVQRALGVPVLGAVRTFHAGILAQMGAFNGVTGLGLWCVAVVVPLAARDARARALEADKLRAAAELARLRANLHPHFLLNTLSTVAGLVTEDPREARDLIAALGDLLRDSCVDGDDMQTLDDEVRWLRRYAEILEARHRGSLAFRWDIDEASRAVALPRLLLQPLLENAVKHGALRRAEGGEVSVCTAVDPAGGGRLRCVVEDNGPGVAPGPGGTAAASSGRGLALVTSRLAVRYAGAATFRLEASEGRTRSVVEIPLEPAS